jgi:hypothetical protein
MGQISISIVKRIIFRDSTQEFSNTYTYGSASANPDNTYALTLIDEVANLEKTFHANTVSFLRGSLWSSGGTVSQNQMIAEKILSGVGSGAANSSLDPERAILCQWPAGTDVKGRPVTLKKWYHIGGNMGDVTFTAAHFSQATQFPSATRTAIADKVKPLTRIGSNLEEWGLIAPSGRERTGAGDPIAHKYLEHHQFGEGWRG